MNISITRTVVGFWGLAIAMGTLVGCGGPSPTAVESTPAVDSPPAQQQAAATEPKPAATQPKAEAKPKPKPKPKPEPPKVALLNRSFEVIEDGAPKHWGVGNKNLLRPSVDASEGNKSLGLEGLPEGEWGSVVQRLYPPAGSAGRTLTVTVDAKCQDEGVVRMDVTYIDNKVEKIHSVPIPASEEYGEVTLELPITKSMDLSSFKLKFLVRPGAKGIFLVDNVRVAFPE